MLYEINHATRQKENMNFYKLPAFVHGKPMWYYGWNSGCMFVDLDLFESIAYYLFGKLPKPHRLIMTVNI